MATRNRAVRVTEATENVQSNRQQYGRPSDDPNVIAFRFFQQMNGCEEGSALFAGKGNSGETAADVFKGIGERPIVSRKYGKIECFYKSQYRREDRSVLQTI